MEKELNHLELNKYSMNKSTLDPAFLTSITFGYYIIVTFPSPPPPPKKKIKGHDYNPLRFMQALSSLTYNIIHI